MTDAQIEGIRGLKPGELDPSELEMLLDTITALREDISALRIGKALSDGAAKRLSEVLADISMSVDNSWNYGGEHSCPWRDRLADAGRAAREALGR